jgi:hypothetical protein
VRSFREVDSGGGVGGVGGLGQTQKLLACSSVPIIIIIIGSKFNDRPMFLTLLRRDSTN